MAYSFDLTLWCFPLYSIPHPPSISPSLFFPPSIPPSLPQLSKKAVQESGLVDEDTADIVSGVADAVENQAEAGRDASVTDRLKMAGKRYHITMAFHESLNTQNTLLLLNLLK